MQAIAISGLIVLLHASPIPLGRYTCGFCQSVWLAYAWFGYVAYIVGRVDGLLAGITAGLVGVGCTALIALLIAVFTPAFRDSADSTPALEKKSEGTDDED